MILQNYSSPFAGRKLQDYLYKTEKFQSLDLSVKAFFHILLEIADWGTYSFFLSYENYIKLGFDNTLTLSSYKRYKEKLKEVGLLQQLSRGYGGFAKGVGQCSEYRICIENINGKIDGVTASRVWLNSICDQQQKEAFINYYKDFYKIDIHQTMEDNQRRFKNEDNKNG